MKEYCIDFSMTTGEGFAKKQRRASYMVRADTIDDAEWKFLVVMEKDYPDDFKSLKIVRSRICEDQHIDL